MIRKPLMVIVEAPDAAMANDMVESLARSACDIANSSASDEAHIRIIEVDDAQPASHVVAAMMQFTCFCQDAQSGCMWIGWIDTPTVEAARRLAVYACAEARGNEASNIRCVGVARGRIDILYWED